MKKQKFVKSLMIFLFLVVLTLTVGANNYNLSQPRQIILTWQNDPTTTMTITWRTDIPGEKSVIYYSPEKDAPLNEYKSKEAQTFTFKETSAWLHTVELTNLTPDESYWVILQTDDSKSEKFSFRTASDKPKDFTFIVGSDIQYYTTNMDVISEIFKKASQEDPAFFMCAGDLVNAELSESEWDYFFDLCHNLLITKDGRRIPFVPAPGNHEVVGGYNGSKEKAVFYYNRFVLPEPETYYALQYGPQLTILSLDSNHTSPIDGDQLTWLKNTLEEHKNSKFIIAQYHDGAWWGSERLYAKIRNEWIPLFEEYGVDLVHTGHIHSYIRSVPVLGLKTYTDQIDSIIAESLEKAKKDFDPAQNYAPPLQKNLLQLSRGNWEALGYSSLEDGLRDLSYMLSLYIIQTGEPSEIRVFDQVCTTELFRQFWYPILNSKENEDLIDEDNGIYYFGVGGLGVGGKGEAVKPGNNSWWLAETASSTNHYYRATLDSAKGEMIIVPVFYYPEENRWVEGNEFISKR